MRGTNLQVVFVYAREVNLQSVVLDLPGMLRGVWVTINVHTYIPTKILW
jgi:hypothetical protein